jgi:hypothetical protein
MLLVIVGAGASFDSVPSRPLGRGATPNDFRPPLANELFDARPRFEARRQALPLVLQIAGDLCHRPKGKTVEDLLEDFASDDGYKDRIPQLAAVRYYIQSIIADCEAGWFRTGPVSTNLMRLIDRIEQRRRGTRERPLFVTFNYDRLIEMALENRGQRFAMLSDYIRSNVTPVIKLHGSIDWVRPIGSRDPMMYNGDHEMIARQVSESFHEFGEPGPIQFSRETGLVSHNKQDLLIPAIAIPVRGKLAFESPPDHVEYLKRALPRVRTVLTIGWRGGEEAFLKMLRESLAPGVEGICVADKDAGNIVQSLRMAKVPANFTPFENGFTDFLKEPDVFERLLNLTWRE